MVKVYYITGIPPEHSPNQVLKDIHEYYMQLRENM